MADNQSLIISDDVRQKFGPIIELMLASESMNTEERQYWINILPVMSAEQLKTLEDILTNEKNQLAAIDARYGKSSEKKAAAEQAVVYQESRRAKREDIQMKEQEFENEDHQSEQEILKKIQES